MKFLGAKPRSTDESVWISSSDLMSGLMIIFLFISVAFIRQEAPKVLGNGEFSGNYLKNIFAIEEEINQALDDEFSELEKLKWNMKIIPELNLIRFQTPEIMFEKNSTQLAQPFKDILREFFPRYLSVLADFDDVFREIRIEGHTSSEWQGREETEAFIENMSLSQGRTQQVFEYSMSQLILYSSEREISFARNKIGAAAMSSRDLIKDKDGNELPELSRRVEFRHVFDDRKYLLTVQNYLQSQN